MACGSDGAGSRKPQHGGSWRMQQRRSRAAAAGGGGGGCRGRRAVPRAAGSPGARRAAAQRRGPGLYAAMRRASSLRRGPPAAAAGRDEVDLEEPGATSPPPGEAAAQPLLGGDAGPSGEPPVDWPRTTVAFIFPALGGMLFGYDIGATGGAVVSLQQAGLAEGGAGLVTALSLVGALLGSGVALAVGDKIGRRKELLLASALYGAGGALTALAAAGPQVLAGRVVYGLGIGFAMHAAPAYIAETCPSSVRGLLISMKEVLIVAGILLGYVACFGFLGYEESFRYIYGVSLAPALVLGAGMFFLPPSPRWLAVSGAGPDRVLAALKRLRAPAADVGREAAEIAASAAGAGGAAGGAAGAKELFSKKLRKPLLIGMSLMLFQQITGQPSVLYYATKIFADAGLPLNSASQVSIFLGLFKLAMTGAAVFVVDSAGRRPLLLGGVGGMVLALLALGTFYGGASGVPSVVALLLYVGCYQISFGPISWLINSEIYPLSSRGAAIGLATLVNFASNAGVGYVLPALQDDLGMNNVYYLFAAVGALAVLTIYLIVPETKGKSLEEIEKELGTG